MEHLCRVAGSPGGQYVDCTMPVSSWEQDHKMILEILIVHPLLYMDQGAHSVSMNHETHFKQNI